MRPVSLTVNGRPVSATIAPRTHLADFLREHLNLTGTHLRCEQGACGACTVLIDGQPARSCITFAALCDGAEVDTIEGLRDDPTMLALQKAFAEEHALQCGYCTPGMLVTARDIVLRLPDADTDRIRLELSGNLCRCTGYVGIVRAIARVLDRRRTGALPAPESEPGPIGPVGARSPARDSGTAEVRMTGGSEASAGTFADLGLGQRKPTLELSERFTLGRPAEEVARFFADPGRVIACLPGASLVRMNAENDFDARMSLKLGPIGATFAGRARVSRGDDLKTGLILGSGRDAGGGSLASGELRYAITAIETGGSAVELNARMLIAGPLAQFARAGIVNDFIKKIIEQFVANVEAAMAGAPARDTQAHTLRAGALLWSLILARVRRFVLRR